VAGLWPKYPVRRIQYHRYGGPEEMRLEPYALPAPGRNEVLVRVRAACVNPIPAALEKRFDIVLDTNGSLTPAQGDALVKRAGFVIDTHPCVQKFVRSLCSRRRKFVFGNPTTEVVQKIADLAGSGKLPLAIGRVAPLDDAIALIADLEAGRGSQGKAVIVMR
jgi:NADPH:quinone reductase-like Zn-dependent oxidoreductase